MTEVLKGYMDLIKVVEKVPLNMPNPNIQLPKLKKINKNTTPTTLPKLKLPKLQKV